MRTVDQPMDVTLMSSNNFPHLWTLDAVDAVSKSDIGMATAVPALVVLTVTAWFIVLIVPISSSSKS